MAFLTKRSNGYWNIVEQISPKKRIYRSTKTKSKSEANIILSNYLKNNKPDISKKLYLSDLESAVLKDSEANNYKPNTITIYKSVFRHMNNVFKNKELNSINKDNINEYKIYRKDKVTPVSVNLELRAMKKFLRYAFKNDMIYNDLSKKIELYKIKDNRRKIFTDSEIKIIFEKIKKPELKDICMITYLTGSRRNEILNIRYKDIDFSTGVINIYQEKPLKEIGVKSIPITDELNNILNKYFYSDYQTLKYYSPDEKLFFMSPSNVTHSFKRILRENKIDDYLHFHSLRHTAATNLLKRGAQLSQVQLILGHSSTKVTEGYIHLQADDLKTDLSKLSLS